MHHIRRRAAVFATAFLAVMALATPGLATGKDGEELPATVEFEQVIGGCPVGGGEGGPSILVEGNIVQEPPIPDAYRIAATVDVPGLGNDGVDVVIDHEPGEDFFALTISAPDRFAGAAATIEVTVFEDLNENGKADEGEARSEPATTDAKFGDCNKHEITSIEQGCATADGETVLALHVEGRVIKPVPAPATYQVGTTLFIGGNAEPEELPEGALLDDQLEFNRTTGIFTYDAVLDLQLVGRGMTFGSHTWDDVNGNGVIDDAEQGSLSPLESEGFTFPASCDQAPPATQPAPPVTQPGEPQLPDTGSGNGTVLLLLGGLLLVSAGTTVVLATRRRQARSSQPVS
jgi:LPXTG-motif cell wall-anchored protein